MRVEFFEGDFCGSITLIPETIEESTKLARFTLNAKSVPANVSMYFNQDGSQSTNVYIPKIKKTLQKNSINKKK